MSTKGHEMSRLIQRDAGLDLGAGERDAGQGQGQVSDLAFFDEKHLVAQAQFAAQPDAAAQPDFGFAPHRQVQPSRRLVRRHLPHDHPLRVAGFGPAGLEAEFALERTGMRHKLPGMEHAKRRKVISEMEEPARPPDLECGKLSPALESGGDWNNTIAFAFTAGPPHSKGMRTPPFPGPPTDRLQGAAGWSRSRHGAHMGDLAAV